MRLATVLGLTLVIRGGEYKVFKDKMAGECDGEDGNGSAWKAAGCCLRLYLLIITCGSFISAAAAPARCRCSSGVVSGSVRVLHVASPVGF
jgi:hypothetical protein